MAAGAERLHGVLVDASLGADEAGVVGVGPEGVGEAPGGDAGRFHSLLDIHAKLDHVEEHLGHGLALDITGGRAEGHPELAVAEGHGRVGREARPLSGGETGGMAWVEPVLGAPGGDDEAKAGDNW